MQTMSWIVIAKQRGMGGKRTTVGPFEDRTLAEQAAITLLSQQVGSAHDVWDSVTIEEADERD